jgi:hypothetical protein
MNSKYISPELRNLVASRANYVCEYCLISDEDTFFGCQVEHIISRNTGAIPNLQISLMLVFFVIASRVVTLLPSPQKRAS